MTTEEQILGLVAMLGSRIGDLEARMRDLQQQMAARRAGDRHHYAGAFRGEIGTGSDAELKKLYIREGYIWAGLYAADHWPSTYSQTDYANTTGLTDGDYLIGFDVTVDSSNGTFHAGARPELAPPRAVADFAGAQGFSSTFVPLGIGTVASAKWTRWQQRWHSDIILSVWKTGTYGGVYVCSLEIQV
jgi:hypothetical protein